MKQLYLLLACVLVWPMLGQDLHCGTDIVMHRLYEQNPALKLKRQQADEAQRQQQQRVSSATVYTVPIVFHILHLNGPENISDAQVRDAVRILNRDYARRNPDTTEIIPAFKNIADSTSIHFELATIDPTGQCTNGIKHYYDPDTDWNDASPTLYSHTWDPTKYLNVYIVRTITLGNGFGAAGYTWFPGTWLSGDSHDAIVVLNHYFGSIGTGANFLSRVLTHEVGHWFNLYHVFGMNDAGASCSGDDLVNDTPVTPGYTNCPNPANPAEYQLCTPGLSENFQNYMDYSYCCRMFTQGQAQRMQAALQSTVSGRSNLWSNTNLVATGVVNPTGPCAPIADFKYSRSKTCAGTPIVFSDATWNGAPMTYSWSFPGGTPATSTASAPVVVYSSAGVYSVTYQVSNLAGTSAPLTKANVITVINNVAGYSTPWAESFENLAALNTDWTLSNSNGSGNWQQSSDAAYTGSHSAKLDAVNNTRKNITAMASPAVDLSLTSNPILTFKVATAEVSANHVNTLSVYASTDCGYTWHLIYNKVGQALVTSSSTAAGFIPSGPAEWRSESISLLPFVSNASVNFKFEYTRDTVPAANNIFIDDINVSGVLAIRGNTQGPLQQLSVFPVPSDAAVNVSFSLASDQKVSLSVIDLSGRVVSVPHSAALSGGNYTWQVNADQALAPGGYFLMLQAGHAQLTQKMIIGQ